MANIEFVMPLILRWEGRFVKDLDDLGKAANMGVTLNTLSAYRKSKNLPPPSIYDLKRLSRKEWSNILKTYYWDRWKADDICNQAVANILVDWVWVSGVYGIKIPQQVLEVKADGMVGERTLAVLNAYQPQAELFGRIKQARFDYVACICKARPRMEIFQKGWNNRIRSFRFSE